MLICSMRMASQLMPCYDDRPEEERTIIVFGSVNARKAYMPLSRPTPDCFEPPKGACIILHVD